MINTEEATIAALQNRIKYLEVHLRLALQVLTDLEDDSQSAIKTLDFQRQSHTIDIVPSSKIELPTFLHARTWKHDDPHLINYVSSRDRIVVHAS